MVPLPVTTPSPYGRLLLHPEVGGAVPGERVELDERVGVEQHLQALARGVAALLVLTLASPRGSAPARVAPMEVGQLACGGVDARAIASGSRLAAVMRGSLNPPVTAWTRSASRRATGRTRAWRHCPPSAAWVTQGSSRRGGSVRAHEAGRLITTPSAPRSSGLWTTVDIVDRTGSTNADLLVAAAAGAPDRSVLVAEHQDAGRGRLARSWVSPPGSGLTVSVLLRPDGVSASRLGWLTLLAGLATYDAVRLTHGRAVRPQVAQRPACSGPRSARSRASSRRWPTRSAPRSWSASGSTSPPPPPTSRARRRSPPRASTPGTRRR